MDHHRIWWTSLLLLAIQFQSLFAQFFPRSSTDFCQLLPDRGPCRETQKRWYYDVRADNCTLFIYGGCLGNQNNFEGPTQCEITCRRSRNMGTTFGYMWPTTMGFSSAHLIDDTTIRRSSSPLGVDGRGNSNVLLAASTLNDCDQPVQRGFCSSFIPRWQYNGSSCELFYYSGCGGNGNNYLTRESCVDRCVVPASDRFLPSVQFPASSDLSVCALRPQRGDCRSAIIRWYFDLESQKCMEFVYSGCNGNENNYGSQQECEHKCPSAALRRPGGARSNTKSDPFAQSGNSLFPGNVDQNPDQQADQGLSRPSEVLMGSGTNGISENSGSPPQRCMAEPERGPCAVDRERWYFDPRTGNCRPFYYGGCVGNTNRFSSKKECESICSPPPDRKPLIVTSVDTCLLEPQTGPCRSAFIRFFFDVSAGRCIEFTYGGCDGNANNFLTLDQCEERCRHVRPSFVANGRSAGNSQNRIGGPAPVLLAPSKVPSRCFLRKEVGPCRAALRKWFFDGRSCQIFIYGGCNGNDNNFDSADECQTICGLGSDVIPTEQSATGRKDHSVQPPTPATAQDASCRLPPDSGPCDASIPRVFFDGATGLCKPFTYGGCGGNLNNFRTVIECEFTCRLGNIAPINVSKPAICELAAERGPCRAFIPAFFHDVRDDKCKMFYFGGCQGNENRFESRQECENTCLTAPGPSSPVSDIITNEITKNTRSGPGTSPSTGTSRTGICEFSAEPGNCLALIPSFFYDKDLRQCRQFIYGGCGGNANRFPTIEECQSTCQSSPTPVTRSSHASATKNPDCLLAAETGLCRGRFIAYTFDANQQTCIEFTYGGCGGNNNRFPTKEECLHQCAGFMTSDNSNMMRLQQVSGRSQGMTLERISRI